MPRQPGQISPVFARPGGYKKTTGLRLCQCESGLHFFAHFKRCRPDTRPQPCYYFHSCLRTCYGGYRVKALINRLQHTFAAGLKGTGQTTPACMRCSHHAAVFSGQQHGQAISHHDGAGDMALTRDARIGELAVGRVGVDCKHVAAMHLLQKHRPAANGRLQCSAVDGYFFWHVADVVAQIHGVERHARKPALPGRENRPHAGWRRPVGDQPVRVQNQGSATAALVETPARPCMLRTRPWCAAGRQNSP